MSAKRFNLSALAVRERSITLFLIILITIAGIYSFFGLGRAEDPPFTVKQMTIISVWPGATAQEIQDQVAEPLEKRLQELKWYDRTETYTRPAWPLSRSHYRTVRRHPRCRKSSIRREKSWGMKPKISPPA